MAAYIAYFYNPSSTVVDGWHDRATVRCDALGCIISKNDYEYIKDSKMEYIGFYEIGKSPLNIWEKARAK